jgi:hypothetical protein
MKKRALTTIGIFSLLVFVFTACPYSSSVPLSTPDVDVDPSIYGKWLKEDPYSDFPKYYDFSKIDGKKFKVEQYEFNSSDSIYTVSGTYVCHFTQVGDVTFANMLQDGVYYFYKLEFPSADEFLLYEVTDNIDEVFNTSKELYEFFKQNKDLSFFYNKDEEKYIFTPEE